MTDKELFGNSEQLESSSRSHGKDHIGDPNKMVGDLISRQAALDAVINLWADKPFGNPALVEIKDCIEALPSAQLWEGEEHATSRGV